MGDEPVRGARGALDGARPGPHAGAGETIADQDEHDAPAPIARRRGRARRRAERRRRGTPSRGSHVRHAAAASVRAWPAVGVAAAALITGCLAADDGARGHVDDQGDDEQHEARGDQRVDVEAGGLREVERDVGRDRRRVARADQVERDDAGDRQDDRDGHRLAERAAEAEHRRADDRRAPNGRTVIRIISQRVAPSASAPSRSVRGVWENTSRVTAVMIGRIITARTHADDQHGAARGRGRAPRTAG